MPLMTDIKVDSLFAKSPWPDARGEKPRPTVSVVFEWLVRASAGEIRPSTPTMTSGFPPTERADSAAQNMNQGYCITP